MFQKLSTNQTAVHLIIAFSVAIGLGLGLISLWSSSEDADARAAQLGNGLATGLASLSAEPLLQADRIHLGVLANRLLDIEPVTGVAVYTVNNETLALSGNTQRGLAFTHPVLADDGIVGYVRLHLDQSAFEDSQGIGHYLLSALLVLIVPLAAVFAGPRITEFLAARERTASVLHDPELEAPPSLEPRYLLTLNLFNQLTLSPRQRDLELQHATEIASEIAEIYQAEVRQLPGTGLLLTFGHQNDVDGPLHLINSAFVLSQLLCDQESWGHYRLGAHLIELTPETPLTLQEPQIRDTTLLSALARERTLVISATLKEAIARPERFDLEPLTNPLLFEMETTEPRAWLIRSLHGSQKDLVDQQVRELSYSRDATSRESTF